MNGTAQHTPPQPPAWLTRILNSGYEIYIAASERLLASLNVQPFGVKARCFTMENPEHHMFHEAYLLSNSLSFRSPDLKMPHWVLIDCALMQTAIVGFMKPVDTFADSFLHYYRSDRFIDFSKLTHIPVSGQIASPAIDGQSLTGISLFSLARQIEGEGAEAGMGLYTKALAFEVHGHERYPYYYGIAQYNNPSLRIHGRFAPQMEIYNPIVPLHPAKDMTLVYKTAIAFDPYTLDAAQHPPAPTPSYWMAADDVAKKQEMIEGIKKGKRYIIAPPFQVEKDGKILLPIIEEKPL